MANFYEGKKVLVTGGTGLIGKPLVEMLIDANAKVFIASLDDPARAHPQAAFCRADLRDMRNCLNVTKGMDIVFHLAGIKGSPKMVQEKPASFFVPMMQFNINMMEAARQNGVGWYLYTSSNGVYALAEVMREDDVWRTLPHEKTAWAKRMSELQAEFYAVEYGWKRVTIVRPANVYGPHDNFDPENAMVIPALISRAMGGEDPLTVWGDGSAIRDFIHARDVARGMMMMVERGVTQPVNLGSGVGVSIRRIVEVIVGNLKKRPSIVWATSKPAGDKKRLMDTARARSLGFVPEISIEDGIKEVMEWFWKNGVKDDGRFNVFRKASNEESEAK